MKIIDLLTMSFNNLRRRPLRTFLTVLGVVIGTVAIVVMISLGIGLKEQNRELIESSGSLTVIRVMEKYGQFDGKKRTETSDRSVGEGICEDQECKERLPVT